MPREKYQTLTEQMFYILLCLQTECCGVDIVKAVAKLTDNRVVIGPGTLYSLLDNFVIQKIIIETKVENRKKSYIITQVGTDMLKKEYSRLHSLIIDYDKFILGGKTNENDL